MVLKDIYFQTRWRIWDQIDSTAKNNQKRKKSKNIEQLEQ